MVEWFRRRFARRFVRILYVEFKSFVARHDPDLARADPGEFEDPPTDYYDRFVDGLFAGGFTDLCLEYPVFARLVATQVRQWVDHLQEFADRLEADRERLAEQFGATGQVTDLEPLADDTHGDGRAVMRVAFESGVTVAYKPRSVDAGAAFYRMVEAVDEFLPTPAIETPAYLARGEYGWMEWIEPAECPDEAAADRYYRRAGALLCLASFTEFRDSHFENLRAAGEHPVLVDAETVLHPFVDPDRRPRPTGTGSLVEDSVLQTLLLPYDVETAGDGHADGERNGTLPVVAGIGVSADPAVFETVETPTVRAVNTDVMTVDHQPARVDRGPNVPTVDGTELPPEDRLDAILDGFESAYETVLSLREEGRLDDVGLPAALAGIENRIVYRPTMAYARVIRSLSSRDYLQDGARFGVEMEELAVPLCDGSVGDPRPWALYDAERAALARLDPPRFTARTDGTEIHLDGTPLGVHADESGLERSRRRIETADPTGLREQLEFVRGCFEATPAPSQAASARPPAEPEPASDEALRREAAEVFESVREAAIESDDGYDWATISRRPSSPG